MKKLYLLALFSLSLVTVFCQTVYTFTNAGATGITGPNQAQVNSAYSATNLNGQVTIIGSGIQDWIVPFTGEYTISAAGASGGDANTALGGKGREITIKLNLTAGHHLRILVGQKGGESSFNNAGCFGSDPGYVGGGGGGTFVFNQTTNSLVIATGGGGGAAFGAYFGSYPGVDASLYNQTSGATGTSNIGSPGSGGSGGNGGFSQGGSSGGGYTGNGSNGYYGGTFGYSFTNGGQGGTNGISSGSYISTVNGGFGGGAGASNHSCYEADGGGGGGYSGGGGSGFRIGAGGGGGNYYTGTYISNSLNTGHGKCLITRLFGVEIDQIAYNCGGASTGELTAQVSGGTAPFTFLWSNGETTQTISNLAPGTYSVIVTDNVGETTNSSITISDPIINASIIGTNFVCSNGSIPNKTVTSIQYRWMMSYTYGYSIDFNINSSYVGSSYTEYDYNCYETVQTYTITNPFYLSNIINGSNSFGYNTYADYFGWVKAILTFSDGSTQTVILSDPTSQAATEGNYVCNTGNPYSAPVTANVNLTTTYSPYPGTLNLTTSQPSAYTYLWETGATTEDIVVSTPGYYTVTVSQAECGYTYSDSVFVTGPTNTISSIVTTDTCGLTNSGAIDVSISGFTLPVSYSWNTGATSQDISSIPSGNYTLTVTDASGCGAVVSSPISVVTGDFDTPNAFCKDTTVYLNNSGFVAITPDFVNDGSMDNCTLNSLSVFPNTFNCSTTDTNSVVLTVVDANGNNSTCTANVIVLDTILANFVTISNDITQNAVTSLCGKVITFPSPTYTDNCSATIARTDVTGLVSGDIFPVGQTVIEYTLTDASGNITVDSFVITIVDIQAPSITNCPSNITIDANTTNCGANVNWVSPTASDNCPGVVLASTHSPGSLFPVGTTTVTYTAVDASNDSTTCSFTVTVNDATAPTVPTLATLTGQCSVTASAPTTTDNCAGTITGTTTNPLTYSTQGTFTIVWTFNDGNGNTSTATQLIIVDDNTDPATPSLPVVMAECGTTLTVPTTTDACAGVITGTTSNQTIFTSQGTFFVLWAFDDGNGNTTFAGQTVIVDDVTAPIVPTLATLTYDCSVTATAPMTTDNCVGTITGTTSGPVTFTTQGTHTIVWTFNDGNGNTSTATQLVVIDDNTAPTISTPSDLTIAVNANGCVASNVSLGSPIATDNCAIQSITNDAPVVYPVGTTFVTWTVTDNSGNTTTAQQTVTVTNNVNATITVVTCGSYTAPDDSVYTTSGVYTSVIPSVFGCDSTITINLTINNATDSLITATDCSSFELNGQTYTTTGIYTQVLTNAVGCDSLITLDLVITGGDFATAIYTGDSSLVAGPGIAYQWINCETGSVIVGETSDTLSITSNGSYAVIITNANGCSDTSDCVVIENLGVKQLSSLELEVYPNPTRDFVRLEMSVSSAEVVIYDAAGKIINKMNVNAGEVIDFRNVEPGVYFLHINAENSETIKRIVKQ